MTIDITVNGYVRYRHMYNGEKIFMYEHKLNGLLKYSLKEVLNGIIHHKNEYKLDNRVENLHLFKTKEEHHKWHADNDINYGKHEEYDKKTYLEKYKDGNLKNYSKYTLWNPFHCYYSKGHMMNKSNKGRRPVKCFKIKVNGKLIEIGKFLDFVTCEIIHNLITLYADEEVV